MRGSGGFLGFAAALILVLATPAWAGDFPIRPAQCGGYEDILSYFDSASVFTGSGLTVKQCSQLCKQAASACKGNITQASKCSKKAVATAVSLSIGYLCTAKEGQEKKDCKLDYTSYYTSERDAHDLSALGARAQCDAIRDACILECEDPA